MRKRLIALAGKAGAGKDTVLCLLTRDNQYQKVIRTTTRPMRGREENHKDYHFISSDEFYEKIAENEMIEVNIFNNWMYGTTLDSLSDDKINIGVFDPSAIECLGQQEDIDLFVIYLDVDDKVRLKRQLDRECHPDCAEIARRFLTDIKDFHLLDTMLESHYISGCVIPNYDGKVDKTLEECRTIIQTLWTKQDKS